MSVDGLTAGYFGAILDLMKDKYLDQIKEIVLTQLKDEPVQVLLFGSRARGTHHPGSDVDIALIPAQGTNFTRVVFLKETMEDSCVPYKVDIVNLSESSREFREHALKDAVVWKN